jgi:hypothetical protein
LTSPDVAVAMMRLGAESMRDHMLGDPLLTPRNGFSVVRRGGLWCFASTKLPLEVFNHVSGYGTFVTPTQRAIDAVLRHYDGLGRDVAIEMLTPFVSQSDRALLERSGFRDTRVLFQCHLRVTPRPPRSRNARGLVVEHVRPAQAARYAKLATRGFGGRDRVGNVFERGWIRQLRRDRRVNSFIGVVNGNDAATGTIVLRPTIGGLYSGSVLPRFRGRSLQNAMIAARLAFGWARGLRAFYAWSEPEHASARNLRDEGFVTAYEVHLYTRPA